MEGDTAHFMMITFWESEEVIRAFAGDDISVAKYYDLRRGWMWQPLPVERTSSRAGVAPAGI
jgi:hypothetical protein